MGGFRNPCSDRVLLYDRTTGAIRTWLEEAVGRFLTVCYWPLAAVRVNQFFII